MEQELIVYFWLQIKKEKLQFSLCFNWAPSHEGVLGEWRYSSSWRWVVSFMLRPLYPQGKKPWYPLNRMLGGPHSRSGRGGEAKNSQPLPGPEPPIIQLAAQRYTTELFRTTKL
jgi:hypothetical protein